MQEIVLITGGCRSGKTRYALDQTRKHYGIKRVYIATCVPGDEEMHKRVDRHKLERGDRWETVEAPVRLGKAVLQQSRKADVLIVDCLTLWIANLLAESEDTERLTGFVERLTGALNEALCPVIVVSNEVGSGIVPENRLARLFRDVAGFANQRVAAVADRVIWMVAGIPVLIKEKRWT